MSKYPIDWYQLVVGDGVMLDKPGIYRWEIEHGGVYVGRFTRSSRPLREYAKNVYRKLNGIGYRPKNIDGFRYVHLELAKAVSERRKITLEIIENCESADLNARERHYISSVPDGRRLNGKNRSR